MTLDSGLLFWATLYITDYFCAYPVVRAGCSPPFLLPLLSSSPFPFPPLLIASFRSRPILLLFPTFHSLPFTCKSPMSNTITTTTHRYGSEMAVCKMRLRVKNALLNKLGFVQPPYFYTPWLRPRYVIFHKINTDIKCNKLQCRIKIMC